MRPVVLFIGFGGCLAGAAGAILGAQRSPAEAELSPSHFGGYSYKDSDCTTRSDPINVIFLGIYNTLYEHAADHGGWYYQGATDQYFIDHGFCKPDHADRASNAGFPLQPRFHMRLRTGTPYYEELAWDVDPYYGIYTGATAHHEDDQSCGHSIDPQWPVLESGGDGYFYWEGGFNQGRVDIFENWYWNDEHDLVAVEDWGNDIPMLQCHQTNGEYDQAWSDGDVYFFSGDHHAPGLAPTATPGGGGGGPTSGGSGGNSCYDFDSFGFKC